MDESSSINDIPAEVVFAEARRRFFIPGDERALFDLFDGVTAKLPARQAHVAAQFRHNLLAASDALAVPFKMASVSVYRTTFQAFHTAERIRARTLPQEAQEATALRVASQRVNDWLRSPESTEPNALAIVRELVDQHRMDVKFAASVRELLRQGTALVWTGLEILVGDAYHLWCGRRASIRTAFRAFVPQFKDERRVMTELGVWNLFQGRHVIVHKLGRVDAEYIKNTGSSLKPGDELVVSPVELEEHFRDATTAAMTMLLLSCKPAKDNPP